MAAKFVDRIDWAAPRFKHIEPMVWRKAELEREIDRLRSAPAGSGKRSVRVAHPEAGLEQGLCPGIGLSISVLDPGEVTPAHRHTFSVINYIREGRGHSIIDGRKIEWGPGDIFATPGWAPHSHVAEGDEAVVRFSFTDAPLHEKLDLLLYADVPEEELVVSANGGEPAAAPEAPSGIVLGDEGAQLLTYKHMLAPVSTRNDALVWRMDEMRPYLEKLYDDEYDGRRVVMLYHPGTGIAQGTTSTMTAFLGIIMPGEVHEAHRHTSAAINYYTEGRGNSVVGGKRFEWEAGDLALAPGWAPHRHANDGDETVWGITIHDAPLLFHMGTLLWQEVLSEDIEVLGRKPGAPAGAEA